MAIPLRRRCSRWESTRGVWIRRIKVDEELKTIRVEYDATRLSSPTIFQLLRQTGWWWLKSFR